MFLINKYQTPLFKETAGYYCTAALRFCIYLKRSNYPLAILIRLLRKWVDTAPFHQAFITLIQGLLGETRDQAILILKGWLFYTVLSRLTWKKLAMCSQAAADEHYSRTVFIDQQRVINYLNSHDKGLIIATIHMGDYLSAFHRLSQGITDNRQIYIVRNKLWSLEEEKVFNRFKSANLSVQIIRHSSASARQVIRALRTGGVVILFYDLGNTWGGTTTINFFGQPMNTVRGPAQLAQPGKADILPIMCHFDGTATPTAMAYPIIPSTASSAQTVKESSRNITQKLMDIAERHIKKHPRQWHHWHLIPEMLINEK